MAAASKEFSPSFESLSMDNIVSAPLIASARANTQMAREQVKFMMDFCFSQHKDEDGNLHYQPVMIQMSITRSSIVEEDGESRLERTRAVFEVPLLTLIPMNSLAVDEVKIDFEMEVTATEQGESTTEEGPPKMIGKVGSKGTNQSSEAYQRKMTSNLSIQLRASPLPLPVGVTAVLDLFTKNLNPVSVAPEDTNPH
ncbi:MAG: DUF2589 domain-containing protein [Bacteroidota bacterium]